MADEDEVPPNMQVCCMAAGLGIKAALTMTGGEDGLTLPSRGWAPPPATGAPEVEVAFALAVQAIVYAFDLPPEQVEAVADGLLKQAGL